MQLEQTEFTIKHINVSTQTSQNKLILNFKMNITFFETNSLFITWTKIISENTISPHNLLSTRNAQYWNEWTINRWLFNNLNSQNNSQNLSIFQGFPDFPDLWQPYFLKTWFICILTPFLKTLPCKWSKGAFEILLNRTSINKTYVFHPYVLSSTCF